MANGDLDFQGATQADGVVLYRRFEQAGRWAVLPHALDLGKRPDGSPDFHLDLVRSLEPGLAGYGLVDFRVVPVSNLAAAQRLVPDDVVEPAYFRGGWLRLLIREPGQTVSSTLLPPLRLSSNGLGIVRLAAQLTPEGATLLKRALLEGSLLVDAWAEMEVQGMSARLPATVTLRAADVLSAVERDPGSRLVSRANVVKALRRPEVLPGIPTGLDRFEVAEAVADRLRNQAASLVPSPTQDLAEWWTLELNPATVFEWDLRQPVAATRIIALRFDPVGLVRQAVSDKPDRLIAYRDLPDFKTGYVPVLVTANLLDVRSRVLSCGVDIQAAPNPPHRMSAIRETVEFALPGDRAEVILHFAANESTAYLFQTFLFVKTDTGVSEWRSARNPGSSTDLLLTAEDFAARFVAVTASPQLLAAGDVAVVARWTGGSQTVTLSKDHPTDALVYPSDAREVGFSCRLTRNGRSIEAAVAPAAPLFLDLPIFRQFGTHAVEIDVDFIDVSTLVAVEIKPEDAPDSAATTLSFVPSKPKRSWTWLAVSPFAPGYRYRVFQSTAPASTWSAPQSAFEPLHLKAKDLVGAQAGEIADKGVR